MDLKKMEKAVEKEDYDILLDSPLVLIKYGKTLTFKPIKWLKWEKFSYNMAIFLREFYIICGDAELPNDIKDADKFIGSFRKVMSNKKALNEVLKMAKLSGFSRWWIKRNFSIFDYAELFLYMYLVNIKVVKKNCKIVLRAIAPALLA